MTQALLHNTDIIKNSEFAIETQPQKAKASTSSESLDKKTDTISDNFDKILDNKVIRFQASIPQNTKTRDNDEKESHLNEIIEQSLMEANVEKSLDLTLAKDIAETINSIKLSSDMESEVLPEQDKDDTPVFEQILTFANNNNDPVQNKNVAVENGVNSEKSNFGDAAKIVYKEKDYELRDTHERSENAEQELDKDMLENLRIESISAETENYEGESMANQDSPEEFGVKVVLNHSLDKTESAFSKMVVQESAKPVNITSEKVIEQITKHMDALKNNSGVKIVLNPESLGKLNLQILTTKDGLSAQFTVTSNEARDLLMKGLDGLKETLLTQGIGVDNISVKVTEAEESSYQQDWTDQENSEGGRREQQKQNREEKEKGLFEKTIAESLNKENGKV